MAEHFVGPVIEKLIDACFDYLKDQLRWQTGMKEELQSLKENHHKIKAVVSVYRQVAIEDLSLNKWLWQLRDAIDEADDVLDEFKYWNLQEQISENKRKRRPEVTAWDLYENVKSSAIGICKRAVKSNPTLKRLEEAVHKLHKISAEVSTFQNLLDWANQEQQRQQLELYTMREAGSMPGNELLGRSMEMDFVRGWLRNSSYLTENTGTGLYKNISLLSVVGHGGMGKTTLLQHVFQDEVTREFDVKMFVCVSKGFDAKTVIKDMLQYLQIENIDLDRLGVLQNRLKSKVMSKKFLLVLDDTWEEEDVKWENLLAPLQHGSLGSKILITTRLDSVATKLANIIRNRKETLPLKGLEVDYCLQLFNIYTFSGVENPDEDFREIAEKMVEKLSGSPLAAKVMGGILNSFIDKLYWINILDTDIGKVNSNQNNLMFILKLSYIYLPKHLQNCFAFCCIFPQGHKFDKDDLVRMWIVLGFLEPSNNQGETLEDIGRRYFNSLVQKSFFDEFHNSYGRTYYKMHDLLHELAQFVSAQECFRIVDNRAFSIPKTIRHLSINGVSSSLQAAFQKMGELKNLRSLFLSFTDEAEFDENVINGILKASKNIRLLVINPSSYGHNMLEKIECLIHLRYLKVEKYRTFKFPRSISHLYLLEFIICKRFPELEMGNISLKELMPNENCKLILERLVIRDPSATQLISN